MPFEYLVWHLPYAVMPLGETLEQLELFATKVMPEFGLEAPEPPVLRTAGGRSAAGKSGVIGAPRGSGSRGKGRAGHFGLSR